MTEQIFKWSNPNEVVKKAVKLLGEDVKIALSSRKDKKYMILNPETNKWVHFGEIGYEDFTKHHDELRRQNFLNRNKRWKNSKTYSPSYLSYFLLW